MDWLYVLMPISGVTIFWPGLIILGLGVGIIGGFFGMGGAWMVTPGLNILGFPMAFAVGTDVAHMAGKSLISTLRHGKFGNVDYKLGLTMLAGTIIGVELGAQMLMWLERLGSVDKVVRWLYVVLLICMAWMVFHDVSLRKKKEREAAARGEELSATATGIDWASKLHAIRIPPMVHFHGAGIYLLRLAAHRGLPVHWLAGRYPRHRRRSDPHARPGVPGWLPHPRGRGYGPLRSGHLRPVRRRFLHLQGSY